MHPQTGCIPFYMQRSVRTLLTYDDVYRRPDYYWGREPNRMARQATDLISPSEARAMRAIDLGCGEGRDLIHFARHGFQATGVDLSAPGLAKARAWAAEEGLSIRTEQASLLTYRLQEPYDLVYSSGTLTYIPPALRAEVIANYKEFTRPGGYNIFNVFVEKPFIPTPHDWGADEYFYRSGELLSLYWDWEVVHLTEFIFDCNSGGQPHRHAINVMIARKVSTDV